MNDTDRSQAFTAIFQTIQELKAAHAAQERRNVEALREAAKEIEAMLVAMQEPPGGAGK